MRENNANGNAKRKSPIEGVGMRVRGTSSDGVVRDRSARQVTRANSAYDAGEEKLMLLLLSSVRVHAAASHWR